MGRICAWLLMFLRSEHINLNNLNNQLWIMSVLTILLFFLYLWGLGYTATSYLKKEERGLASVLVDACIGLGIFPFLAILLNFLHLPLDWKLFLVISMAFPAFSLFKKIKSNDLKFRLPTIRVKKSLFVLFIVLVIFGATFYMYTKGAFVYPYLENEDPWNHAVGAKYVSIEKNAYDPPLENPKKEIDSVLAYIDPYPPAYNILMGVLHQTSSDLKWTLKFFNALLISLGIIFFFLFTKNFIGSQNKALFATFALAAIPGYLSHFIWAHGLVVTLFFPLMYAFQQSFEDKRWLYVTAWVIASVWVSQNISQPLKITTMIMIFLIVFSIAKRKILWFHFASVLGGIAASFLWWGVIIKKYTLSVFLGYFGRNLVLEGTGGASAASPGIVAKIFSTFSSLVSAATNPGGSASRAYNLHDFVVAKSQNMINNPIGVGIVLSLLTLLGVVYVLVKYRSSIVKGKNAWMCVALFWLIFTFWGVNGLTFPVSVAKGAFRVWMLMAIPLSIVAAEGAFFLLRLGKKFKVPGKLIMLALIVGILLTSAQQKYDANTAIWPTAGAFNGAPPQEPFEYGRFFDGIPPNTKVFLYAPRDKITLGFGMFSCLWCQEIYDYRNRDQLYDDANALHAFLKKHGYQYLILNGRMDQKYIRAHFGTNNSDILLPQRYQEILNSGLFTPVHQVEGLFVVLKPN